MPAAAGLGGRGQRSRLGNLTNTAGDASGAAASNSKRKSSLARAAAALQGTAVGGGEEILPTSPVSTSPTSAFSERSRSRLLGGERWRPRRQRRQEQGQRQGGQPQTHAQQLQMRVLELHRRGHAMPLEESAEADADEDDGEDYGSAFDEEDDNDEHYGSTTPRSTPASDHLERQFESLLERNNQGRPTSSAERMPPPPPRNADRPRKGGGNNNGAELSFVGGKKKERMALGGTIAALPGRRGGPETEVDDDATVLTKATAATAATALTANTSFLGGAGANANITNQTHESDVILAQWRRERERRQRTSQRRRQRQGQGQGQGQQHQQEEQLRVDTDLLSSTVAAAATMNAGDLRIRGIRWSEQEEDPEEYNAGNHHGGGGFQLHADVSALTTTFDQHTNDGVGMRTPIAAKARAPMSTPLAGQARGIPNHPGAKTPSSILRTPSASAPASATLTAVSSPMATPKLSPIQHRHNDQRSIASAEVTNAACAAAVPASGSNRERHLSNQIATLKAKLGESNDNRTEQQEQIWTLTHRLQQMEAEAESAHRDRDEVQTKLTTTAERIGRALHAIFAVLDGGDDNVDDGNRSRNFAAAGASSIPITDDVDVVVSRLVDDALPLLQRQAAQSSRTLVEAKAELGIFQSEISSAEEQLQALEKDQAEAEHEAVAARDRTKSIRMELSAVDEQLSSGRNDLAHVQETATPKLSPIQHRHNDQRSIASAEVTNAACAAAVPASGSNRERHLSNQIATLKAKLGESNDNRTEQQEQIWTLTHRLQQMEAEAESAHRDRDEVQTKLTTTAERIGRALHAIFAVLDGGDDNVDDGNRSRNFAAAGASSIPITDDVDVVVSRLVDDALPLLQRQAAQSSRTLVEAKAELGIFQSEISSAEEQLQALEKDQAEAEHEAVAARDRTKSIRMELSAVDEQLSSGRNDLAHVQETIAALHTEERQVESHLNEMRGEVKSKKEETEELTKMAQERLEMATAAEKSAKEAIDQSHVVKEGK